VAEELGALLSAGERAAFHGRPLAGVEPLERARAIAVEFGRPAEAGAAGWLLGVCLTAGGRYGAALDVLGPLAAPAHDQAADLRMITALAASAVGSVHRQLGRHEAARELDLAALERTDGTGEAAFDAQIGLAADAIGLGDAAAAGDALAGCAAQVEEHAEWWRQRVRLGWVGAELALLQDDAPDALALLEPAIALAERSGAPRHVAKGLLFLGVAQVQAGALAEAPGTLRRAAVLAESLGARPLVWPARAVLGTLLAESDEAAGSAALAGARSCAREIADDLPEDLRAGWLARPDVAALLAG
jgi:tetratricopeptide (TPR) repeat protein